MAELDINSSRFETQSFGLLADAKTKLEQIQPDEIIFDNDKPFENLFSEFKCHYIFSFPIDRYPMDVMNRVALRYNITQIEITVCLFKETSRS